MRLRLAHLATGVGIGTAAALVVLVPTWLGRISPRAGILLAFAIVAAAAAIAWWHARSSRGRVVAAIERQAPAFRNLLVTSAELADHPDRGQPLIRALVWADASAVAASTDVRRVVPLRRAGVVSAVSALAWIAAAVLLPRVWASSPAIALASGQGDAAVIDVTVRVQPPAYTAQPASSLYNPDHLDVLAGSRLTLEVEGRAATMNVVSGAGASQPLVSIAAGRFSATLDAAADGYLAIEPISAAGVAGPRRLLPLTVQLDRPPTVRVTAPAKDLYVGDASKTIDVTVAADDDLGVRSLKLVYTRVSGSGENFTFTDGEAPLRLTKTSDRSWTGQGQLALAAMALVPGDTVVYRAVALDSLPTRAPVESDAFLIQVLSTSDVAMEGFATGDDREKYALSEQMIVVKTEQLHAKRSTLAAEALNDEAMGLSAMQRSVRAEFVFMLGGELEDIEAEAAAAASATELHEENEAAGEQDLLAGRMQNQGRQDVLVAIRKMSDAATSLAVADTATALVAERAAVAALQRAFSKSRLILRTLSVRERIDPARRLSGDVAGEADWRRSVAVSAVDPRAARLRRALEDLTAFVGQSSFTSGDRARLVATAESILQIDTSAPNRAAAARVIAAADAVAAGRDANRIAGLVSEAAVDLAKLLRDDLGAAPDHQNDPVAATLAGALADRLRRTGGGR